MYVFIHGGGFRSGDKKGLPAGLLQPLLASDISVAAINYRLSGTDPYPAAMEDAARAIQFLRFRAKDWRLDRARVAAGGGSAGGGITFWIGYREDMADPHSDDLVRRESTRLTCIASWNTQSSYDPHFIRSIISGGAYREGALLQFFRVTPEEFDTPCAKQAFREASAINHVTKDAPPTFLWYSRPNVPMTPDLDAGHGIHHPKFGEVLKERMAELGVECVLRLREDLPDVAEEGIAARFHGELVQFVARHLLRNRNSP